MVISNYGKLLTANIEFEKGVAFLAAAELLKQKANSEPQKYVVLHLIAQGVELVIKGSLYGKNFDVYRKSGRKIGHRLEYGYELAAKEFGLNPLTSPTFEQLKYLSGLHCSHALRYAGVQDIFILPDSIDISLVKKKILAAVRLGRREYRKAFEAH